MMIRVSAIAGILREEDVEGLIAQGAPADEYDAEAEEIARTLSGSLPSERTGENVTAALALIWARCFDLSPDGVRARLPALRHVAERILAN